MQVYLITNKINGKMYVGQTSYTLECRWSEHVSLSKSKVLYTLQKAIRKYGEENFAIETLHVCESKEEMDFAEMFYIALLNTKVSCGYNLTDGGDGCKGHKHSEESRAKIKESRAKQVIGKRSEETRRKMSIGISKAKPWNHGTKTGRVNHKCTCILCLQWGKDKWQEEKKAKPPREKPSWNAGTAKGVYERTNGTWVVTLWANNALKSYGTYKTKEEAEQRLAEIRRGAPSNVREK